MKPSSNSFSEYLYTAATQHDAIFKPEFLYARQSEHLNRLNALSKIPGLQVFDSILEQIAEWVKFSTPWKKYTATELEAEVLKKLAGKAAQEYGVWVYYPWSNRLVHLLDREEFISVRTSRNQYKITPAEKEILQRKKIGVIGLSVGQSVSVTLAMERICGELRLADFDRLELTNLNRIRTGLHNLGLPKVYSVAREIAEIDPFIEIKCFPEGITEANMETFFMQGGKLDLMIEESDGFDIKILSRYKARELKVPVLMEASDRCMVDVERFDLEPERSILHGFVDHLDIHTLKNLKTTEEKIPYMLDVLGIQTASPRLKASMLEIEQSINTWPQLASAVTMGGGICADVARRLLLGQFNESGRYFVDVEEIISDKRAGKKTDTQNQAAPVAPGLEHFTALVPKLDKSLFNSTKQISQEDAQALVSAACKAPSGGNSQPWRWVFHAGSLVLFNAFDGNQSFLGAANLPSYVAFGAAIENLALLAAQKSLKIITRWFPDSAIPEAIAVISFEQAVQPEATVHPRVEALDLRLTNRMLGARVKLQENDLAALKQIESEVPGAELRFFTSDADLEEIGEMLAEVEKIRLLEEFGHRDFVQEVRWSRAENDMKMDGVDLRTLDITNTERVGLQVARDEKIMALLREWNGGGAFKKLTRKSIDSASAIGLISMKGNQAEDYIMAGRLLQKVWLQANLMGIAFQPVSASLFVYARLFLAGGAGISEAGRNRLMAIRPRFEKAFGFRKGMQEVFVFRLSLAGEPQVKALRKPMEDVYCCL